MADNIWDLQLEENFGRNKLVSSSFGGQIYASVFLNLVSQQDKNMSTIYIIYILHGANITVLKYIFSIKHAHHGQYLEVHCLNISRDL